MQPTPRQITPKQQAFADGLLEGLTGSESYKCAYNTKGNSRAAARKAVDLRRHPAIVAYIAKEQAKLSATKVMSREEKLRQLEGIILSPDTKAADKIKAIACHNQMLGHHSPEKVEAFGLADLLGIVREGYS